MHRAIFGGFSTRRHPRRTTTPTAPLRDVGPKISDPARDYALRVQRLKANFRGDLTENHPWRLNVWGMKKEGTRQVNCRRSTASILFRPHNAGQRTCHVVSRSQNIDWLTMEIEPVIEARFGWLTVEYSARCGLVPAERRTGRHQQLCSRHVQPWPRFQRPGGAYAYVPGKHHRDRPLKLRGQMAPDTICTSSGIVGNTHNKFRESDRKFYGVDARIDQHDHRRPVGDRLRQDVHPEDHSPDTVAEHSLSRPGIALVGAERWRFPRKPPRMLLTTRTWSTATMGPRVSKPLAPVLTTIAAGAAAWP
jgi:hypothetical protein